ncbi:MAG: AbrB/MazE/SpoVT family DNA-binding domain-containing protein [Propionibacteriaceae bacterium]|nr:AbrB/MazE/SpoVT family DNA-binding domain-containing protein [Propionibacteriaceae bacterium]
MEAKIDSGGRILVPKLYRESLGLLSGTTVDISAYGSGLQITPGGRAARIARGSNGRLVAHCETPITDDIVFSLVDSSRR